MSIRSNKASNYKQNRYVKGYVPATLHTVVQPISPISTSGDGSIFTSDTFKLVPLESSTVRLTVNGVTFFPANGIAELSTSTFYITDSTGLTVRINGTCAVGDILKWQSSVSGYEILSADDIKLIYEI